MVRTYAEESGYLEKIGPVTWRIKKGFVPNMNVEGVFYVNDHLESEPRVGVEESRGSSMSMTNSKVSP